ncbi:hypothetical protein AB833_03915 [Chromatiales bacterium (ex Bugula neritina AB1)]|nr:hypothetical protein AB833_03915 [Chromatiales bacterium (ex Bugula neritina AB1)]
MRNPDASTVPLVCSLTGTLLKTDLVSERRIQKLKNTIEGLLSSSLDLKRLQLEQSAKDQAGSALPLNEPLLEFLREEKKSGRKLVLLTAESPECASEMLGNDHQLFDETIDCRSANELVSKFGEKNYDYIGDSSTSSEIWHGANKRFVVAADDTTAKKLSADGMSVSRQFAKGNSLNLKSGTRALRTYQWLKNLLVFVPIITSQQLDDANALRNSIIMFICFSLIASFGYLVNDLLDLASDRAHPKKRHRPLASGNLSIRHGVLIGAALLVITAVLCLMLPGPATIVLIGYLFLTISYSLYLKTKLMIDVVALGILFTLRVIGGAAAIETELSFYLLSFSIFIFSSLGMVKRFAELHNLQSRNQLIARGRSYRVEDMAPVRIIGISLGYMSVFIMGLYINSPVVTQYYDHPKFIWFLFPLLTYWLGRLWILANRGEVNEDPLIFAMKDKTSLLVVGLSAVILLIAN